MNPSKNEIEETFRQSDEAWRSVRFHAITYPLMCSVAVIGGVMILLFPVYSEKPDIGMVWWLGPVLIAIGVVGWAQIIYGRFSKSGREYRRKMKRLKGKIDRSNANQSNV